MCEKTKIFINSLEFDVFNDCMSLEQSQSYVLTSYLTSFLRKAFLTSVRRMFRMHAFQYKEKVYDLNGV